MRIGPSTAITAEIPFGSITGSPISDSSPIDGCISPSPTCTAISPRRMFQETIEQFQHALLFFQRAEQLAHLFLGQMQIQADQVAGAFHVNFGAARRCRAGPWSTAASVFAGSSS